MTLCRWHEGPDRLVLDLPDDLDLAMAGPLVADLRQALAGGRPVTVEAGAVERVSSASVQALLAATRAVAGPDDFRIAAPSDALVETCAILGLGEWLAQWSRQ